MNVLRQVSDGHSQESTKGEDVEVELVCELLALEILKESEKKGVSEKKKTKNKNKSHLRNKILTMFP